MTPRQQQLLVELEREFSRINATQQPINEFAAEILAAKREERDLIESVNAFNIASDAAHHEQLLDDLAKFREACGPLGIEVSLVNKQRMDFIANGKTLSMYIYRYEDMICVHNTKVRKRLLKYGYRYCPSNSLSYSIEELMKAAYFKSKIMSLI
jgi:hypothetical protein